MASDRVRLLANTVFFSRVDSSSGESDSSLSSHESGSSCSSDLVIIGRISIYLSN